MKPHLKERLPVSCPALVALAIGVWLVSPPAQGQLQIDSLGANGLLSWSALGGTGTHYAVEWASSVDGEWRTWQEAVTRLTGLGPTGVVDVPMFYRVVTPDRAYNSNATYSYYYQTLPTIKLPLPLASNEMRITFMGSMIPLPVRLAQAEMSVFVEVGWQDDTNDANYHGRAVDQFVFDCGAGVSANYAAASVNFRRMDKVFINHLHADHMNDLAHIYCFGPSGDRKSPLFVFGPGPSGVESPTAPGKFYDDGTSNFCAMARAAWRWHSESFSFQPTRYTNYANVAPTKNSWGLPVEPIPVSDDPADDAYAMIPIQLNWTNIGGVAYHNQDTRAKVTHYPVIHARKGSIGYKLEWTPPGAEKPLTMIYSSDTKPETNSVDQACNDQNGVDVFIHEMVIPPDMWAWKQLGLSAAPTTDDAIYSTWQAATEELTRVQNSSHTPQGAYGYLLSQISPPPRLAVATHFPVADDTVASAFNSVQAHCTNIGFGKDIVWSFDLLVLRVFPDRIEQLRADVSSFAFSPQGQLPSGLYPPKYSTNGVGNPFAQIDLSTQIAWTNLDGTVNYSPDGY
jgi:ribonuclease Z